MKTTTILGYSAIAVAFVTVASSLLSSTNAFAFSFGTGGSLSNSLSQAINQAQSATQSSSITSSGSTTGSGTNVAILSQNNTGSLTGTQSFQ